MRQLLGLMPNTKQRRRGNAFAKGSPPHGLWPGPKLLTKSHKDGMVRARQPKGRLEPGVEKYSASTKTIFLKLLLTVPLKSESSFLFTFYFLKISHCLSHGRLWSSTSPFHFHQPPPPGAALSNTLAAGYIEIRIKFSSPSNSPHFRCSGATCGWRPSYWTAQM